MTINWGKKKRYKNNFLYVMLFYVHIFAIQHTCLRITAASNYFLNDCQLSCLYHVTYIYRRLAFETNLNFSVIFLDLKFTGTPSIEWALELQWNYFFVDSLLANLTSSDYAEIIKERIKDDSTSQDPEEYGAVTETTVDSGTAHVSVLAPDGSAVSVTSTINQV